MVPPAASTFGGRRAAFYRIAQMNAPTRSGRQRESARRPTPRGAVPRTTGLSHHGQFAHSRLLAPTLICSVLGPNIPGGLITSGGLFALRPCSLNQA